MAQATIEGGYLSPTKPQGERRIGGLLRRSEKHIPPQLINFEVSLEDEYRVYFAGETIKGHVKVKLNDGLPLQGIIVRIVGEAYVNVSDESRPWTAVGRLSKLRKTLRANKISPSTFSDQSTQPNSTFFCGSDVPTLSTDTASRSQKSTLQRDNPMPSLSASGPKLSKKKQDELNQRFRSHEKYFEHKMYVFGHRYSSSREMMWSGEHIFPFSYDLPSKLPASFHGRFGYVRYFCEASLERHTLPTVQKRAFFSVGSLMDLNADSKADSGVDKEKKTNSWCFCCPSGTIIVSAKIKKRGFVPGEMIPIQAFVLNVSNKPIHKLSARIVQIATYFSSKGLQKRSDETVLVEKIEGLLPPGESSAWDDEGPCVPPCPPSSTMIDCKLITIDYRLEFALDIYKAKEPLILRMPLRIGGIPMEKSFRNLMETPPEEISRLQREFPAAITMKYASLPCALSLKCVKGDRNVNRYYFKQIPRSMHSMVGLNQHSTSSRAIPQPVITDESETYAPRYLTFINQKPAPSTVTREMKSNAMTNGSVKANNQHNNASPAHGAAYDLETVRISDISSNGPSVVCSPSSLNSYKSSKLDFAQRLTRVLYENSNNNEDEGPTLRRTTVGGSANNANGNIELDAVTSQHEDKKKV